MSALETPEEMAERLFPFTNTQEARETSVFVIGARDQHIADALEAAWNRHVRDGKDIIAFAGELAEIIYALRGGSKKIDRDAEHSP